MKKLILFFSLVTLPLFAGERTLLSGHVDHGGYGGPVVKYTQIGPNNADGVLVGGQGGWIIDHRFVLGGAGYGLTTKVNADWYDVRTYAGEPSPYVLDFGYGGVLLSFIGNSDDLVHYEIFGIIGSGGVNYRLKNDYGDTNNGDAFFVAEPGVNVVLNVTHFFRIGFGGTYRYVRGVDLEGLTDGDLSNFSAQVTFKFGAF